MTAFAEKMGCSRRTAQRHKARSSVEWVTFCTKGAEGKLRVPAEPVGHGPLFEEAQAMEEQLDSLEQARRTTGRMYAALQRAIEKGDVALVATLNGIWAKNVEVVRRWEAAEQKLMEARGAMVPVEEVKAATVKAHTAIAGAVLGALEELANRLAPKLDGKERRRMAAEVRDAMFEGLGR